MGSSTLFSAGYHSSPLHILQYWAKKTQFNFTKWEIQHHFLLVTTVFHDIHCNTGQNKTTTTKSNNNKKLFNFTKWEIHHCFLLVIILNYYIQCNTGLKKRKEKRVSFTKWEIHHCFLLVAILHHYIHCNIRLSKTVQFHQVGNSPPFSAGHHSPPLHSLQH